MAIDCSEQNFHLKSLHDTPKTDKKCKKRFNVRHGDGENSFKPLHRSFIIKQKIKITT